MRYELITSDDQPYNKSVSMWNLEMSHCKKPMTEEQPYDNSDLLYPTFVDKLQISGLHVCT